MTQTTRVVLDIKTDDLKTLAKKAIDVGEKRKKYLEGVLTTKATELKRAEGGEK